MKSKRMKRSSRLLFSRHGAVTNPPRAASPKRTVLGGAGWLVARQLRKTYRGREVIKDISLMVRRGEAIALLGPNGAGKTTALLYDHRPGAAGRRQDHARRL